MKDPAGDSQWSLPTLKSLIRQTGIKRQCTLDRHGTSHGAKMKTRSEGGEYGWRILQQSLKPTH